MYEKITQIFPFFLHKIKTKTQIKNLRHGSLHMTVIIRHVKS